ncbi:hypothetical protein KGF57_000209 [Candida theae]|uniref:Altered inheritance of mitochondria protein 24, mitochondrial n=1 Tax=Candida theae TaxID=1198502 RepID=A0AAD5BJC0_9ASCO|nr:uncharacterized protein KGF57_000209 [Candida theae]KAI5968350.1 hypothetical protein KGF57_000209 [Candida theae]
MRSTPIQRYASIPLKKPQITGAGPFAARPQFHAIGHPSTLLSISFPQTSSIYISKSSILASNVKLDSIHSDSKLLHGRVYHCLQSTEAANVLVHGQHQYRVLDASHEWTVFGGIVGWTGSNLSFKSGTVASQQSVAISGRGAVVLDSASEILNLQVEANDEVMINQDALVAINTKAMARLRPDELNTGAYKLHRLEIPHFDWPDWIVNYTKKIGATRDQVLATLNPRHLLAPVVPYWVPVQKRLGRFWHWMYNKIRRSGGRPKYLKITGPATVLIDNHIGK